MSYQAIICKIYTRVHPGADKLQLGTCYGHQVIVGLDTQDETLGCFFPVDGQLSHEMCYENNLYRTGRGENKDKEKSGYFESSRRLKTINLRGAKSEGLWIPLEFLAWTGIDLSTLVDGYTFTDLNGKGVCQKYYTQATRKAMNNQGKKAKKKKDVAMFFKHFDTGKLKYNIASIPNNSRLIITAKLHGTSGRTGHVLVTQELHPLKAFWNKYFSWTGQGFQKQKKWQHVSGSRNVILDYNFNDGYYKNTDFRKQIHDRFALRKGETIYYEIVGWTGMDDQNNPFAPIMGIHSLGKKRQSNKTMASLAKQYGESMVYSYGCEPGEFKVYVYRITMVNEDCDAIEYSWDQVKARCKELGLNHVPELQQTLFTQEKTYGSLALDPETLMKTCEVFCEGSSILDDKHIEEGVCIRIEHPDLFDIYKFKGFNFLTAEGIIKDSEDYIDLEEIS